MAYAIQCYGASSKRRMAFSMKAYLSVPMSVYYSASVTLTCHLLFLFCILFSDFQAFRYLLGLHYWGLSASNHLDHTQISSSHHNFSFTFYFEITAPHESFQDFTLKAFPVGFV